VNISAPLGSSPIVARSNPPMTQVAGQSHYDDYLMITTHTPKMAFPDVYSWSKLNVLAVWTNFRQLSFLGFLN
jgi:hypothetical protein